MYNTTTVAISSMSLILETLSAEIAAKASSLSTTKHNPKVLSLVRASSKLILLSENNYEGLWIMENEDKVKLEKENKELKNQLKALTAQLHVLQHSTITLPPTSPPLERAALNTDYLKW